MKASVVIANYNNEKYIEKCINSLKSQTYDDIEIIFFDDNSSDNSLDVVKNFSNIKIIENKEKSNYASLNQLNAFKKAINLSNGELIFFLDSDDFFHEQKIETIVSYFIKNSKNQIVFDLPIEIYNNSQKFEKGNKNVFKTYWQYIYPTSCITIKKSIFEKLYESISSNNFTDVWMDLRICIYAQYVLNQYNKINQNLTYYRKTDHNVSSKFKKYSKNWWKRRKQAHEYFYFFCKNENIKFSKNIDYLFTKFICSFI